MPTYAETVLADSPRLFWRLGESTGSIVNDASVNGYTGTYYGSPTLGVASLLSSDTNTAVSFDAVDDQITIADAIALTAWSVEFWIKHNGSGLGNYRVIIDKDAGANNRRFWNINLTTSGKIEVYIWSGAGAYTVLTSTKAVTDNKAHHVVATMDWASNTGYLYIDGAQEATGTRSGSGATSVAEFQVAKTTNSPAAANMFNGTLDEIAYYSTALSAARVYEHYKVGTGPPPPPPIPPGTNLAERIKAGIQRAGQEAKSHAWRLSSIESDPRWTNARTPTAHVASHGSGGSDAVSLAASQVASGTLDLARLPVATSGTSSTTQVVRADDSRLANARTPTAHASTHASGGTDAITPAAIGAAASAHNHAAADTNSGTFDIARIPVATSGTSSTTAVVRADDARLSDARTPSAHQHPIGDITATGTRSSSTFLRGDGQFAVPVLDTGWVNFTSGLGEVEFNTTVHNVCRYRRYGNVVQVHIEKATVAARDVSTVSSGDFVNRNVTSSSALPETDAFGRNLRPQGYFAYGSGYMDQAPAVSWLNLNGTILWVGGLPRSYPSGSLFTASFTYLVD